MLPSGEKATDHTESCPLRVALLSPLATSHSLIVPSAPAARVVPSAEKARVVAEAPAIRASSRAVVES